MSKKSVLIPLAEGAEEIEVTTIFDVLDRCGIEPLLLSVSGSKLVKLSHGLAIQASDTLRGWIDSIFSGDIEKFSLSIDAVLLPGGMPGATNLRASDDLVFIIKQLHARRTLVGAICASPAVVLGPIGVVTSKTSATCYPAMKTRFEESGVEWVDSAVVFDKASGVLTSQGPGTTAGFALVASALLIGSEVPLKVNAAMLTNWHDSILQLSD